MINELYALLGEMVADAKEYRRSESGSAGMYASYYKGKAVASEEYAGELQAILDAWKRRDKEAAIMLGIGESENGGAR